VSIRNRFRQRGIIADVVEMDGHSNAFLVTFLDSVTARKVYSEKEHYELRSVRVKFSPRAGPTRHVKYRVLRDTKLFEGKSSKSSIGVLKRGAIITANQLKKRRVRIIEGKTKIGWVNLFTESNEECLIQIGGI